MNLYDTETVVAGFLGVDEETFANRSFEMVQVVARLKPYYVSLLLLLLLFFCLLLY